MQPAEAMRNAGRYPLQVLGESSEGRCSESPCKKSAFATSRNAGEIASYLAAMNAGADVSEAAARLIRSGVRMQTLVDDLCDFNRTKLGLGINITPCDLDLAEVVSDVVDQLRAVHPDRQISLDLQGDLIGTWDGHRLQQLLGNLMVNALKYGAPHQPIRVVAAAVDSQVRLEVASRGPAIDPLTLARIFEPLERGAADKDAAGASGGLGLGLYIASEIAKAHHGSIDARSDERETVFTVWLPRRS